MSGVDDLFEGDRPAAAPPDRVARVRRLLAIAAPLNFLSVACFTGVPGAILTLIAWHLADEELARVESGALPEESRDRVLGLRRLAFLQLSACGLSFLVQMVLFGVGVYDWMAKSFLELLWG